VGFSKMAKNLMGKADVDQSGQLSLEEWVEYILSLGGSKATKMLQLYENALTNGCGGPEAATKVQSRVRGRNSRKPRAPPVASMAPVPESGGAAEAEAAVAETAAADAAAAAAAAAAAERAAAREAAAAMLQGAAPAVAPAMPVDHRLGDEAAALLQRAAPYTSGGLTY
jgi:hypothetical protein